MGAHDGGEAQRIAIMSGDSERGEVPDERGAERRREETTVVRRTMRSNLAATVSSRQRR